VKLTNILIKNSLLASITLLLILTAGCSEILYYGQATKGQLSLLLAQDDIRDLIEDENTPPDLRHRLSYLLQARQFAEEQLSLPTGDAYLDYVSLDRDYVLWNITAAEEFSLSGHQWCYPVVGCQSYRGYFSEKAAKDFARSLHSSGLETWVSGIDAYSTLGWFDDPVLSTFLKRDDTALAALLFHELAHRVLYIDGDTAFNESFATAVEQASVKLWMQARGTPDNYARYQENKNAYRVFVTMILATNQDLKKIYQSDLPVEEKRQQKQNAFADMREKFAQACTTDPTLCRFQGWVNGEMNNAKLITVANYHQHVDAFMRLLTMHADDFSAFFKEAARLGELPEAQRQLALKQLSDEASSDKSSNDK
jgi:predicted aminopeptidase